MSLPPTMPEHYRLLGGPGSPYSLKMRAILRYRRLPHLWIVPPGYIGNNGELALASKKIIPVLQYPDGSYWADSTPLAHALEARHPGQRSIIPDDPGLAFLSHLIEDLADEVLPIALFDMRWGSQDDITFCARRQMSGWLPPMPASEFEALVTKFTNRQVARRAIWVAEDNHSILADFYLRLLAAMEQMHETTSWLFGSRPSLGDFGLYGQLSQCAIDPTASSLMRRLAPRSYQWTQTLDDACGIDGEWAAPASMPPAVGLLLDLVGEFHLPLLLAHSRACASGDTNCGATVAGRRWVVRKAEPYKLKCLTWLRHELAHVPEASLQWLRPLLQQHGCWDALQRDDLDAGFFKPMAPL